MHDELTKVASLTRHTSANIVLVRHTLGEVECVEFIARSIKRPRRGLRNLIRRGGRRATGKRDKSRAGAGISSSPLKRQRKRQDKAPSSSAGNKRPPPLEPAASGSRSEGNLAGRATSTLASCSSGAARPGLISGRSSSANSALSSFSTASTSFVHFKRRYLKVGEILRNFRSGGPSKMAAQDAASEEADQLGDELDHMPRHLADRKRQQQQHQQQRVLDEASKSALDAAKR